MNWYRALRVIVSGFVGVFVLSACSGSAGGQAAPEDPSRSNTALSQAPSSDKPNGTAAPRVTDPLEVSELEGNPCTALSDVQRDKLRLKAGTEKSGKIGLYCAYYYANGSGNNVSVGISKPFTDGLSDVYAKREALGHFQPTTIAGYPAVYAGPYHDRSAEGECQLFVGFTDTDVVRLTVILGSDTHDYSRPCDVADLTAKTVIQHLQDGS